MPIQLRSPSAQEWTQVLEILSRDLRGDVSWTLSQEYPTILGRNNFTRSVIAVDGAKPVSHAAYYPYKIKTAQNDVLRVAAVGQVWTDPAYRGQGLATKVLLQLEALMKAEGLPWCLLWTGDPRIYQTIGYVRAGRELDWVLEKADFARLSSIQSAHKGGGLEFKEINEDELIEALTEIKRLHERHSQRAERSSDEWSAYASIPRTEWCVARNHQEILAYMVIGKGKDMSNAVHEWGGDVAALIDLLRWICSRKTEAERLLVLTPDDSRELFLEQLRMMKLSCAPGIVGYAKKLDSSFKDFERITTSEKASQFFLWGFDSV